MRIIFILAAAMIFLGKGVAIDPVCKMTVDEKKTKLMSEHDGAMFYFCSAGCKAAFDNDPHRYGHAH
jgi:P-type Cu+ transporter